MRSYGLHSEALRLAKAQKDEAARAELRKIRAANSSREILDEEARRRFEEVLARLKGKANG